VNSFFYKLTNFQAFLTLLILGIITFLPTFSNGFVADDNIYILDNPIIKNFNVVSFFTGSSYYVGDTTNLSGIYYKPVFTLITSLLFQFSFGHAFLFHSIQLFLHILTTFLVFFLFSKFFSKSLSLALGILFLIHPGNVETVVYAANLQDVLFPLFGISAFVLAFSNKISWKKGLVIALFLLLSLLSKESGMLFLPTILLLAFLKNRKNFAEIFTIVFSVFFSYLFLRIGVAHVYINHQKIAPIMEATFLERVLTIPKIVHSYLLLFLFPKNLWWGQHWVVKTITFSDFYLPLITIFLALIAILFSFIKSRSKQKTNVLFFSGVLFFGLLLHVHIIPLDFTFAERWFYFPAIGLLGVLGTILELYLDVIKKYTRVFFLLFILIVTILCTRSFIRVTNWKNDFTLTSHDLQNNPDSFVLQNNLGLVLLQHKNYESAKIHLVKSLELYPTQSAYGNLAFVYSNLHMPEQSIMYYKKALSLGDYYLSYQNLIAEEIRQNKLQDAEENIKLALKKYPNNPKLWLLFAVISYNNGNIENAVSYAQQANLLSPDSADFILSKIAKKEKISL